MKVLKEEITFNCNAENLWSILSDVTRCDWVPSVSEIKIEGDCRLFEMDGMGVVKEKILKNDSDNKLLQYSAVETRTPINHHLATMNVQFINDESCKLIWTTEIDPEIFAEAIHHGMLISIEGIKQVLKSNV